jgi:hypothetical protein
MKKGADFCLPCLDRLQSRSRLAEDLEQNDTGPASEEGIRSGTAARDDRLRRTEHDGAGNGRPDPRVANRSGTFLRRCFWLSVPVNHRGTARLSMFDTAPLSEVIMKRQDWAMMARRCRCGTRAGATAIRRSRAVRIASASIRPGRPGCEQWEGQGAARQVFGAMAIHSGRPPGSSPGAGDLLRRVLGRAGAGCSTSFRRRDRGLCVVLLPPSSSVLTRTVERHRR